MRPVRWSPIRMSVLIAHGGIDGKSGVLTYRLVFGRSHDGVWFHCRYGLPAGTRSQVVRIKEEKSRPDG